jgi:hypothetical protein
MATSRQTKSDFGDSPLVMFKAQALVRSTPENYFLASLLLPLWCWHPPPVLVPWRSPKQVSDPVWKFKFVFKGGCPLERCYLEPPPLNKNLNILGWLPQVRPSQTSAIRLSESSKHKHLFDLLLKIIFVTQLLPLWCWHPPWSACTLALTKASQRPSLGIQVVLRGVAFLKVVMLNHPLNKILNILGWLPQVRPSQTSATRLCESSKHKHLFDLLLEISFVTKLLPLWCWHPPWSACTLALTKASQRPSLGIQVFL